MDNSVTLPLSVPGKIQGKLIFLGNSNCVGLSMLAALTNTSREFNFAFLGLVEVPSLLELELERLFLTWGSMVSFNSLANIRHVWQSHCPLGISVSFNGGSLK